MVQRIYDQSPMQKHLGIEKGADDLVPPRNFQDRGVNFTDARSKVMLDAWMASTSTPPSSLEMG